MIPSLQGIANSMYKAHKKGVESMQNQYNTFADKCATIVTDSIKLGNYTVTGKNTIRIDIPFTVRDAISVYDITYAVSRKIDVCIGDVFVDLSTSCVYVTIKLFEI